MRSAPAAIMVEASVCRGELRALKWSDVDLKGRLIRVERTLDDGERAKPGETIVPKTKAGRRRVPIPKVLQRPVVLGRAATSAAASSGEAIRSRLHAQPVARAPSSGLIATSSRFIARR